MFSSKPKNRKRNTSYWGKRSAPRRPETARDLREKEYRLSVEIDSLEDMLAELEARKEKKVDMRRNNILPPPEREPQPYYWQPACGKRSQRKRCPNRNEGFLQFLILLAIACALAFWLFHTGG